MARRTFIGLSALVAVAAIDAGTPAYASPPGVVIESARTAADSVRDGVLTFARTTRDFVLGGVPAAQDTWDENVEAMRERARQNADRVREEAGLAPAYRYRDYDDREYYRDDERNNRDEFYDYRDEPLPPAAPYDDRDR